MNNLSSNLSSPAAATTRPNKAAAGELLRFGTIFKLEGSPEFSSDQFVRKLAEPGYRNNVAEYVRHVDASPRVQGWLKDDGRMAKLYRWWNPLDVVLADGRDSVLPEKVLTYALTKKDSKKMTAFVRRGLYADFSELSTKRGEGMVKENGHRCLSGFITSRPPTQEIKTLQVPASFERVLTEQGRS